MKNCCASSTPASGEICRTFESTLDCKKQVLEKPLKIGNFKSFAAQTKCGANAGSRTVQGSKVSLLAAYRATCTLPCTRTKVHTAYICIPCQHRTFCLIPVQCQNGDSGSLKAPITHGLFQNREYSFVSSFKVSRSSIVILCTLELPCNTLMWVLLLF